MAVYIDDSGSHGYDAEISGVEDTDWSRDATNQTFKLLTDTGSADTGFTLSSTTGWILIESYNINGNDAGTVMWRSLTSWQSDVSTSTIRNTAMTDFRTDMATIISGTNITAYDAKCTYFDGTDAHVYEADEATAFPDEASPTYTVSDYSPASSLFTITNTLTAPSSSSTLLELQVSASSDDTEENVTSGGQNLTSGALEMSNNSVDDQIIALRFDGATIPQGSTISSAYLEFVASSTSSTTVELLITGEKVLDGATFTSTVSSTSARLSANPTTATTVWTPSAWTTDTAYQSSDISSIIEEIVGQASWVSTNALVLFIENNLATSTDRPAYSYDNTPANAAKLIIEWS